MKALVVVVAALLAAVACGSSTQGAGSNGSGRVLSVIAAESFWGSIATQLGGSHVRVQSVVTDPNADPHEYESNTNDARAFAQADMVIQNGAGYDSWSDKLLHAGPNSGRRVVNVADLLGKKEGDNPHFWYNPAWVAKVADRLTATYRSLDGGDAAYFDQQRAAFAMALRPYNDRVAEIKSRFPGTKVGATESIFVYMAQALGLNLVSPPAFMNAVAEGNDPPADAVVTFQDQVAQKQIKVLVYNVQTATAVTTNLRHLAAAKDIPIVGVSETLQPETATFQDWQLSQLLALENALNADALVQ